MSSDSTQPHLDLGRDKTKTRENVVINSYTVFPFTKINTSSQKYPLEKLN